MDHGDPKFGQNTSALFYHVTIEVIVNSASLTHEHQCFMRVSLDDDIFQVEVLRHSQPTIYGPQFRREA
ncbi:hypothetical protein H5410_049565 [Solanum commersonii]|uniref:Uncharacterized protein n=1 Tax=Solanum commersonii TaxID=4109 RepID=A0A9J5WT98_SOLCO|nr:hypothetical protein H5410_049565 [Solanum commersonii]